MLPSISIVDSVEMIRDGGSLAAVFHVGDSCEYWLYCEILLQTLASGDVERKGYAEPKIVNRHTTIELAITWDHALVLLGQIGRMIHLERDLKWHKIMREVAVSKGELPMELEKVLQVVQNQDRVQYGEGKR